MEAYFILTGVIAGLLAGLLGVGGGLIYVPALFFILPSLAVRSDLVMPMALATSLATIVVTSLASSISHYRQGAVITKVFLGLSPGLFLGALAAGEIARHFNSTTLTLFFIVFELFVAFQLIYPLRISAAKTSHNSNNLSLAGLLIGVISALVGIGGGSLTVPYLLWRSIALKNAIAISAACGLPIAIGGMLGFIYAGINVDGLPENAISYIYWPALVFFSLTGLVFAPLGAMLTHRLPTALLKKIFSFFLFVVAIRMLFRLLE